MEKPLIVVLAGGVGVRFAPLSIDKTLTPFLGKPLLQHTLEMIERSGATEVLITTNEDNSKWITSYNSKLKISTKLQQKPLGMGDAVLNLENEIGERPVIIMNAVDIVEDSLLINLLSSIENSYAVITGMKVKENLPVGYLKTENNRVLGIVEKPKAGEEPSNLMNLVFHYFSQPKDLIEEIKQVQNTSDDQYEQALSNLMQKKEIKYSIYDGYWQKLKYSHFILDMTEVLLNKKLVNYRSPSSKIAENATIEGTVYIDDGAKIYEGAVIKGPAYIGKNVVIGNHTLIRESIIEESSVIGFGSEVARSYIGPRCMLHHNFIGDSILESDINPSYGTCTTNMRIDGAQVSLKLETGLIPTNRKKLGAVIAKGVFCGVNCTFLPGVTVGENAKIYPGTIVHTFVKANTTLKTYQEQTTVPNEG